jgi:hypothetical protein
MTRRTGGPLRWLAEQASDVLLELAACAVLLGLAVVVAVVLGWVRVPWPLALQMASMVAGAAVGTGFAALSRRPGWNDLVLGGLTGAILGGLWWLA